MIRIHHWVKGFKSLPPSIGHPSLIQKRKIARKSDYLVSACLIFILASLESSLLPTIAIGIAATSNPRITVFEKNSGVVGVWEGLSFGVGENVKIDRC